MCTHLHMCSHVYTSPPKYPLHTGMEADTTDSQTRLTESTSHMSPRGRLQVTADDGHAFEQHRWVAKSGGGSRVEITR